MRPKLSKRSAFGELLQKLRKAKGMTQEELAKKIGGKKRLIVHYENGVTKPPSSKNLIILAKALNTTPEVLLNPDARPTSKGKSPEVENEYRQLKQFRKFSKLPPDDQQTVIDLINSLGKKRKGSKK